MAIPAGLLGINWPEGFALLEQEVSRVAVEVGAMPYERLANPSHEYFRELASSRFGQREGAFDIWIEPTAGGDAVRVLLKAGFSFRWWPLGHWVVWEGFQASGDGARTSLSIDELGEVW